MFAEPETITNPTEVVEPGKRTEDLPPGDGGKGKPPAESLYKIQVEGVEEEFPLSKILDFAQQGRFLAQEKGRFNEKVEVRAQELAQESFNVWLEERKAELEAIPTPTPEEEEDLNDTAKLLRSTQKDLKSLMDWKEQREGADEDAKFEATVVEEQGRIDIEMTEAKKLYPLANDMVILATLSANPKANILSLAKHSHTMEIERRAKYEKEYLEEAKTRNQRGIQGAGGGVPPTPGTKLVLGKNTREAAQEFLNSRTTR